MAAIADRAKLAADHPVSLKQRVAKVLGTIVFISLLGLIVFTAVPYGTAEAWWKAFFVCAVFALAILWLIEGLLSDSWIRDGWPLILPIVALAFLSFLQTVTFGHSSENPGGISFPPWNAISADPYQTRFFVFQLLSLMLAGVFIFRYASTEGRLRTVINVVIGIWFAVAVFRRTRQNLHSANRFRRAACFGATIGIIGVAVHSLVDFGLHMIVNALVFTTLVTIATSNTQWASPIAKDV